MLPLCKILIVCLSWILLHSFRSYVYLKCWYFLQPGFVCMKFEFLKCCIKMLFLLLTGFWAPQGECLNEFIHFTLIPALLARGNSLTSPQPCRRLSVRCASRVLHWVLLNECDLQSSLRLHTHLWLFHMWTLVSQNTLHVLSSRWL